MRLASLGGRPRGSEASTQVKSVASTGACVHWGQGAALLPGSRAGLTGRRLGPAARPCDFKFERFLVLCAGSLPRRPLSLPPRELSGGGLGADVGGGDILGP